MSISNGTKILTDYWKNLMAHFEVGLEAILP
jgi:hypothetical protein